MTVLITGGTGFVGLALAERLLADGHAVRLFAPGPLPDEIAGAGELAGVKYVTGDIRDGKALARALSGDITGVVHLAAVTPNREREMAQPAAIIDVNVGGTAELVQAVAEHAGTARLLLVSSVAVYGTGAPSSGAYEEASTPADPQSLYGITKRSAEDVAARLAALYDLDLVTVRLGPVFGPWEHTTGVRALLSPHGQVLALAAERREAILLRPMAADWLYSRDAGRGLAALLSAPRLGHRLYNLGGGRITTVEEWCRHAAGLFDGLRWRMAETVEEANVALSIARDRAPLATDRIHREVGFEPRFTLDSAVEDHSRWIAAHRMLRRPTPSHPPGREHALTDESRDTPIIELKDVGKMFGAFEALKEIDLTVRRGQRIVICGPSGSGKSTLIRCINGLESHDSGEIRVDGTLLDTKGRNLDAIRREVGMVFQHFNLFPHLTVLQNLTIAPIKIRGQSKAEAEERARALLERVKIAEHADKRPSQLSGGQQQRVAIARALCMQPEVMLFDEPTSALDPEMIKEVLDVMVQLAEDGMTMICVTHEMGFARSVADEVVFMDAGRVIERADPDSFFNNPENERAQAFLSQIIRH